MPPVTAAYEDEASGITEPLFERLKLSAICCDASSPGYATTRTCHPFSSSSQDLESLDGVFNGLPMESERERSHSCCGCRFPAPITSRVGTNGGVSQNELDQGDWRKELVSLIAPKGRLPTIPCWRMLVGSENPIRGRVRSTSILTTYILAFFHIVLKGQKELLLSGPSKAYPEVSFVRSST
jgi:hypothetical protein